MKTKGALLFLIVFLNFQSARASFHAFSFLDSSVLQSAVAINLAVDQIRAKAPPRLFAKLPSTIDLKSFTKSEGGLINSICQKDGSLQYGQSGALLGYVKLKQIHGTHRATLHLHDHLLGGRNETSCSDRQLEILLQRTLIHELTHIYDQLNEDLGLIENLYQTQAQLCQRPTSKTPYYCYRKYTVSDNLNYLLLTGFKPLLKNASQDGAIEAIDFERVNILTKRSPRSIEFASPQESFAVNMEYFTFDPEYKCRKPSTYIFLKEHFNYEPYPEKNCASNFSVFLDDGKILVLDPSRIYAIHYLKLEPGPKLQSRWGHAMLKLIICSPRRTQVGSECEKDTASHLIVDFAGQLAAEEFRFLGALTGQYANGMTFTTYTNFLRESIFTELRNASGYPLTLTKKEIQAIGFSLIEKYWSQISRYYFIKNNCSTQVLQALAGAMKWEGRPNSESIIFSNLLSQSAMVTPAGLTKTLIQLGIIEKENSRLPVDSPATIVEQSEQTYPDLNSLKTLPTSERFDAYNQLFAPKDSDASKIQATHALMAVERMQLSFLQRQIQDFWRQVVLVNASADERTKLFATSPSLKEWEGYGVPNLDLTKIEKDNQIRSQQQTEYFNRMVEMLSKSQKDQYRDFKKVERELLRNIQFLIQHGKWSLTTGS